MDGAGDVRADLPILTVEVSHFDDPGKGQSELRGFQIQALDDTGATGNFISREIVDLLGLPIRQYTQQSISLGNQSTATCDGVASLTLALDPSHPECQVSLKAYVVGDLGFPLILGHPFGVQYEKTPLYTKVAGAPNELSRLRWTVNDTHVYSPLIEGIHSNAQLHHMVAWAEEEGLPMVTAVLRDSSPSKPGLSSTLEKFNQMRDRSPARLRALLTKFIDIFVPQSTRPDPAVGHGVVASIPTNQPPVSTRQFPLAHSVLEELRKMLTELQDKGWVETAHSPYNNPIFLVKKPNGKWRIVLDFRGLNKSTVKDKYRLPRVDDLLDKVMRYPFISTMDLVDGFYQIPLAPEDRHKTAFTTPWGSFQWTVMPMGLCNAPSIFQGVTDALLQGQTAAVGYIDDLAVGGDTEEAHDQALEELFVRIRDFGLHLSPAKCFYGQQTTQFLGYTVGSGQLKPTEAKLKAVQDFPRPRTQTQVRSFLGLVGYHGRFIKDFHVIAGPLEELCGKTDKAPEWAQRNWGDAQEQAFETLKLAMTTSPVLRAPNWSAAQGACPFILATDASGYGMGACLMQREEGNPEAPPRPIGYWSRHFNALERRVLATHERELGALMEGLEFFETFIVGYSLEVWCDHRPLEYFWSQPHITAKQGRWAARIAKFLPFSFVYVPGKDPAMGIPDALSRKVDGGAEQGPLGPLLDNQPDLAEAIQQGRSAASVPQLHAMGPVRSATEAEPFYALLLCAGQSGCVERYIRTRHPNAVIVTLDSDWETCPTLCGDVKEWRTLLQQVVQVQRLVGPDTVSTRQHTLRCEWNSSTRAMRPGECRICYASDRGAGSTTAGVLLHCV